MGLILLKHRCTVYRAFQVERPSAAMNLQDILVECPQTVIENKCDREFEAACGPAHQVAVIKIPDNEGLLISGDRIR